MKSKWVIETIIFPCWFSRVVDNAITMEQWKSSFTSLLDDLNI